MRKVVLFENCVESDLILGVKILRNDCFDYVSSPSAQIVFKKCCSSKGKGCVGYIAPTILAKLEILASTQQVVSSLAFFYVVNDGMDVSFIVS